MNKQDIVIKIAKITRLTGEIKHCIDVDGNVNLDLFVPDLLFLSSWIEEIYDYVLTDKSPNLEQLIRNMGFNDAVESYVRSHRNDIRPSVLEVLENYFFTSRELIELCNENSNERKGKYIYLVEPLANAKVAELLDRAVDAGILDKYYQPIPGLKVMHLMIIAYAVSSICKFKHQYTFFEKQWGGTRISTSKMPRYRTEEYEKTMSLYPEVDFSDMIPQHKVTVFYITQNTEEVNEMYLDLIKYKYISPKTTFEAFKGIVGKADFTEPVEWIKGQRQLGFYIFQAFNKYNSRDLWIKGECCFSIKGKSPHRNCFFSGYSYIKRHGLVDNYDVRLKSICDKFNNIDSPALSGSERLIHTSKLVFHSSRPEERKKRLYSDLLKGGYIAPETTYDTFRGIFEEIEFTQPIVWMNRQSTLIYFTYLVFKVDNPYDLWTKCVYCFRLQGNKKLNRNSLDGNCIKLIRREKPYNMELKKIADEYNRDAINSAEASVNMVADAHNINT